MARRICSLLIWNTRTGSRCLQLPPGFLSSSPTESVLSIGVPSVDDRHRGCARRRVRSRRRCAGVRGGDPVSLGDLEDKLNSAISGALGVSGDYGRFRLGRDRPEFEITLSYAPILQPLSLDLALISTRSASTPALARRDHGSG